MSIYLNTAKKQIKKGTVGIDVIRYNLMRHFLAEDEANFNQQLKADYDALFPEKRTMTQAEKDSYLASLDFVPGVVEYPLVEIDYSTNPDFLTFDQYKNESVEINPAVDATYDADGLELTPYKPAVFEAVRPFVPQANYDVEIDAFLSSSPVYAESVKKSKVDAINSLTVTVDGMVFDADPISRQNMADAILASTPTGITETQWKLADNSVALVTLTQLTQAHALAIQSVGSVVIGA